MIIAKLIRAALRRIARFYAKNVSDRRKDREKFSRLLACAWDGSQGRPEAQPLRRSFLILAEPACVIRQGFTAFVHDLPGCRVSDLFVIPNLHTVN